MAVEEQLVRLVLFLAAAYGTGQVAQVANISPIIAYIVVGALLGPPLANFVPAPRGAALAGLLGIQLSVLDAGLRTNVGDLKKTALRAMLVAVLGVVFPIAGTCLVLCLTDVIEGNFESSRSLKTAFAAGSAIAPTSLGVTAKLLADAGELDTKLGQLISIAAVFDDVISLVLLSQVIALAQEDPTVWQLMQPVVFSLAFIVGGICMTLVLPKLFLFCLKTSRAPEPWYAKIGLWSIAALATATTYVASIVGTSFLLAGFLTGAAFAQVSPTIGLEPWKSRVEVHIRWLSMLFFAATIGFVVPLRDLFATSSLGIGALLAFVGVFGKALCGLGMYPDFAGGLAVGVTMLGRGEFGFLIASQARAVGLLDDRVYAATTWGVLVPTLVTPIVFGIVFRWRSKRHQTTLSTNSGDAEVLEAPSPVADGMLAEESDGHAES